jgi:DNA-directed RNA polymerase specialized sigma24 family protein
LPSPPPTPSGWTLSAAAFERLLRLFDEDDARAALRYEAVRGKLTRFFAWRGCSDPEELADRTFDRVARRLEEGAEIRTGDPYAYIHGVAIRVGLEHWRDPRRGLKAADQRDDPETAIAATTTVAADDSGLEHRIACLGECLAALPADGRRLVEAYHQHRGQEKIDGRRDLAQALGIPLNALRIRAYRLRATLLACITGCERRKTDEMDRRFRHKPDGGGRA